MILNWEGEIAKIQHEKNLTVNEKIYRAILLFHRNFPCNIVQFFQYSILTGSFTGVLSYQDGKIKSIAHLYDSLNDNPYIHQYLINNQVHFFNDDYFQLNIQNKIQLNEPIDNIFFVPFSLNNVPIAFLTGINIQTQTNELTLVELTKFQNTFSPLLLNKPIFNTIEKNILTNKELEIMQHISDGKTTKEISGILTIAEPTVKYFLKNVMKKIDAVNRTEAVAKLIRKGIIK